MKKIKKRPIQLVFWDHASHTNSVRKMKPSKAELVGYLVRETDLCYVVVCWVADDDLTDAGTDGYAILKSAVIEMRHL